ncbi:tRNA wybutosine-synthesizing protein-like protein [Pleurostoma richardsiae]|uniref:tRNA(Phe) 7-[(3-amino-3-carboxypropyl)-4-demethylwyosine(37)-N(4)]-methyltransferase n=1 Tax=Pleurostoma richardsiae TaxID=41990 RepID=A0AA38SBN1_9PEZI|nr:tRNA wybutosine-synthesizing protein-like protein [Pleurostoma richardsiae]
MATLPSPPQAFTQRKLKILEQLAVPDAEYTDASPKGSVDAGIRDLIDEINALDGLATTSSCGGRVSVFLEGRKTSKNGHDHVAGVGGKGGGGTWLFVSHDPVGRKGDEDLETLFGLRQEGTEAEDDEAATNGNRRLIHFKFEPMILHILTASPEHAQLALRCGLQAGFRESGAVNLLGTVKEPPSPMVAIRCMGLTFESLIGLEAEGRRHCTVSSEYLETLLAIANERFAENTKRIERFRAAIREAMQEKRKGKDGGEWEDPVARRERKRAEGLKRAAELRETQHADPISPPEGGQ